MTVNRFKEELIGKKVSVLIYGLKGKEAYVGKLLTMDAEWTVLETGGLDTKIDKVYIRTDTILSVLRYTEEWK